MNPQKASSLLKFAQVLNFDQSYQQDSRNDSKIAYTTTLEQCDQKKIAKYL